MIMILPRNNAFLSIVTGTSILVMGSTQVAAKLKGDRVGANSANSPPDETELLLLVKPHRETRVLQDLPLECNPPNLSWIGDGWCDQNDQYNSAVCGYDGGDCCAGTCDSGPPPFDCSKPFDCKDPAAEDPVADPAEPFTIIFISDVENKYRGHDVGRSEYVVSTIKDLGQTDIYFDGAYAGNKVDPQLVIHGGDISHMWSCDNFWGCRSPNDEFSDVWNQLYESSIPMISAFGNHDWSPAATTGNEEVWNNADVAKTEETDAINQLTSSFVKQSYEKAKEASNGALTYTEFPPTGDRGQSMYVSNFRGLQIGHLGCASNWESYNANDNTVFSSDSQFDQFSAALDRNAKSMFFSHYPVKFLRERDTADMEKLKSLIWQFPGAQHFSGHVHTAVEDVYTDGTGANTFTDFIAPYPHVWNGAKPGAFAILASAMDGVLQVKTIDIPGWEDGKQCAAGATCSYCNAGYWEYWESLAFTACGTQPCWGSGTVCGWGTCTNCCNGSHAPWWQLGIGSCN